VFRKATAFLIFIFLAGQTGLLATEAQKAAEPKESLPKEIEHAFEKAIRKVDSDKAAQDSALKVKIREELKSAGAEWLVAAKRSKDRERDKLIDQKWEDLRQTGPWSHYDYYLKDCEYHETGIDVVKTDSLVVPYKGYLRAREILYAERKHLPNFDVKQFLYTVTTAFRVVFEYKDGKFIPVAVEKENPVIKQGWPQEMQAKAGLS
jgi:hypothetical protein